MNKKAMIGGKIFDVISYEEYLKNKEILLGSDVPPTAVEQHMPDGSVALLPIRANNSGSMKEPGIYNAGKVDFFSNPISEEEKEEYCPGNDKYFDFSNTKNLQELIDKKEQFDNVTNQMLETPDSITVPPLKEADTPAMRALKEAVIAKGIDIDKYKERFGANFSNDKRKLSDTDITLFILNRYAECLDMDVYLELKDKPGKIPNPMGKRIVANLSSAQNVSESINEINEHKGE